MNGAVWLVGCSREEERVLDRALLAMVSKIWASNMLEKMMAWVQG